MAGEENNELTICVRDGFVSQQDMDAMASLMIEKLQEKDLIISMVDGQIRVSAVAKPKEKNPIERLIGIVSSKLAMFGIVPIQWAMFAAAAFGMQMLGKNIGEKIDAGASGIGKTLDGWVEAGFPPLVSIALDQSTMSTLIDYCKSHKFLPSPEE